MKVAVSREEGMLGGGRQGLFPAVSAPDLMADLTSPRQAGK